MLALQQCLPVPLDQHRLPLTLDRAAAARMLPLTVSRGLQNHIKASTYNAFKFHYAEHARKYARKYADSLQNMTKYMQNMTKKYAKQYAKYDKKYVQILSICNLVYCDILQHILHILHIAICPVCPR